MWLVQYVVGMYVVCMWFICGQYLVGMWLKFDQYALDTCLKYVVDIVYFIQAHPDGLIRRTRDNPLIIRGEGTAKHFMSVTFKP